MNDITSDKLMDAMLAHQLEGNEMKLLVAYVRLGGWKAGSEVFLPEAKRKEWGISDKTAQRMRKSLIEKGWLVPTDKKSRYGCDKYMISVPALPRVGQNDLPTPANMTCEVGQNDLSPRSIRPVEVTKEVTKEVTNLSNEESAPAAHAPGKPVTSDSLIVTNKEEAVEESLIDPIAPVSDVVPIVAKEREVGQNDLPLNEDDYYEWNGRKILKSGRGDPFGGVATAPVEEKIIVACPKCSKPMDEKELCWNWDCM